MGESSLIETGVDKLVSLVRKNKKISISEAAKQLGVSTVVVEEWADFLEEEGIISMEYKFTTPYLVERLLTKEELVKKEKEFGGKKEAFVRKAEVALALLDKEGESFTNIRKQFEELKENLSDEIKNVKGDLKELEKFEELKNSLSSQIMEQEKVFKEKIGEIESQAGREEKRYAEILQKLGLEEKKLEKEKLEALSIRERETLLREKLEGFREMVDKLEDNIDSEDKVIADSEEHIADLKGISEQIRASVEYKKKALDKLIKESKEQEAEMAGMHEAVLKKAEEKKSQIEQRIAAGKGASKKFTDFFDKKAKVESLLKKVSDDRNDLEKELIHLIQKAKAFSIASKSSNVGSNVSELKETFKGIEKKKGLFETELRKLASLLRK